MEGSNVLLISNVAIWVLLLILYAAVFLLYRHFGEALLRRTRMLEGAGPKIDDQLDVTLMTVNGTGYRLGQDSGRPHVILFGSAQCSHCERVKPIVRDLIPPDDSVGLILVYLGDQKSTLNYATAISDSVIAVSDPTGELGRVWKVPGTPYAVVADASGFVRKKGLASSRGTLKSFFLSARQMLTATASG